MAQPISTTVTSVHNIAFSYYIFPDGQSDTPNLAYQHFLEVLRQSTTIVNYGKVENIRGNMFHLFPEFTLATSVDADFEMDYGINRKFRRAFQNVCRLRRENVSPGGVAYLNYGNNGYVYYLVIREPDELPCYFTVWLALEALFQHIRANNIKKIAITRIGCDPVCEGLRWSMIKQMIEFMCKDEDIQIKAFDTTNPVNINYAYPYESESSDDLD